jgi:predicted AlkP superfamily pyrophosphatase or phosphodiesterase
MGINSNKRLLVVQVAGLGWDLVQASGKSSVLQRDWQPMETVFPAVTCTVQASFRTGTSAGRHGVVANGWMERALHRTYFWEQSSDLVWGERIWSNFRAAGHRVAMLYWQQSLGEDVDMLLSPAPVHKHHGGLVDATASVPPDLYETLVERVGSPFKLRSYWGPLASTRSSEWIAKATAEILGDAELAPDLCLTYLPGLDYDLQRFGPEHPRAKQALSTVQNQLTQLLSKAEAAGYEWLVFGDYAIVQAERQVFINRHLREAGWLSTRDVGGRLYPELHTSRAFAVVDHEVAHVYLRNPDDLNEVQACLSGLDGVQVSLNRLEQRDQGLMHPRGGDLIVIAEDGAWFPYDWWTRRSEAPDYAGHVDIHNKPGFDPRELFWGWPPGSVSLDATRVGGTHGRVGKGRDVAISASFDVGTPQTLLDLSRVVQGWLGENGDG